MQTSCAQCESAFMVDAEDERFLKTFSVPPPKACPRCRLQRRLCERNTRSLYYRKCDKTGRQIVSQYHPDQPFPVYDVDAWMGDDWDARSYGRDIDFTRPFFEQFAELQKVVPHLALFNTPGTMQNSDYNNCTAYLKNCYLICESDYAEDCEYSNLLKHCKDVVDSSVCLRCERCYECVDCNECQTLLYSQDCEQCSDGAFLKHCKGVRDSIGCINQRQKQYMIFNEQLTKEEYQRRRAEMRLDTRSGVEELAKKAETFFATHPHRATQIERSEGCSGDRIYDSKNAIDCFNVSDCEDCRHCQRLSLTCKTCMDYNSWGDRAELVYQSSACGDRVYDIKFCSTCIAVQHSEYCFECMNSTDLFGCIGIRRGKHCILNKQYSPQEYADLFLKLKKHMWQGGEYGEYFPMSQCAFAYNETFAMDFFPLTAKEAKDRGWRWREKDDSRKQYMGSKVALPDAIGDVDDAVCKSILQCAETDKAYKIIPQELQFYRSMNIPAPALCPDERHRRRIGKQNPYVLWDRSCAKCQKDIQTTYAPERPEIVYCESCYLQAVY